MVERRTLLRKATAGGLPNIPRPMKELLLLFDERNVAAALEPGDLDPAQLFLAIEAHVLTDVFVSYLIAPHVVANEMAVSDKFARLAFDQTTECIGAAGHIGKEPMERHDHGAAAERGKKSRAAIDGAGEDGREDDEQRGVERAFLGERAFVAEAHDDQRENHHDDSAERDLSEGQFFRLDPEAEERSNEIPKRVHFIVASLDSGPTRVSKRRLVHQSDLPSECVVLMEEKCV
jgi:hypothetical protein